LNQRTIRTPTHKTGRKYKPMNDIFGIILLIAMVGIAVWILARMRRSSGKKKTKVDPQTHRERAVWAWARIINSTHGIAGLGGMVHVTMDLEVHLPGTPFFTTKATWLVEQEALEYVEMGKDVSLKVDPLDLKYIYPNGSWAKVLD
jgi:hypothetical protein